MIQFIEFHQKLQNTLSILVRHIIVTALTLMLPMIGLDENFLMQLF
jgi:hypothetical protein